MPCSARKPSWVFARISTMALPIPRTSYVVAVINYVPAGRRAEPTKAGISCVHEGLATYHDNASASKRAASYDSRNAPKNTRMIRHILTVSTGTLSSRMLGFLRDSLIAALLGAGAVADAFLVAFQFINVTRRSFTEGALNAALVPTYLRVRETEGKVAAAAFAGRALGCVTLILICIALALTLLMPLVISVLAPGFVGSET